MCAGSCCSCFVSAVAVAVFVDDEMKLQLVYYYSSKTKTGMRPRRCSVKCLCVGINFERIVPVQHEAKHHTKQGNLG